MDADSWRGSCTALPPSNVGYRRVVPEAVPDEVQAAYDDAVKTLAITLAGWEDPAILNLEPAALDALIAFASDVEPQLRPAARLGHIRDWASKLVGATGRIAVLLHLAANPRNAWRESVTVESVLAAIRLADYYTAHALAAFDAMAADPVAIDAQYALEVITGEGWTTFSRRELVQQGEPLPVPQSERSRHHPDEARGTPLHRTDGHSHAQGTRPTAITQMGGQPAFTHRRNRRSRKNQA